MTQRYKLTIEYDGTPFVGWQKQDNGRGVQDAIADAILGFCGEHVTVAGAGRTDTGVHALGQVAHIDIERETDADTVRDAINFHLKPQPISILLAEAVSPDFDARFSAVKRHYLYRIINRRAPLTVDRHRAWQVPVPLDAQLMDEAAQQLVGKHDFTTFRAAQCQAASPVKTLDALDVRREGEAIVITARARSFLHNQIRSFAGTLKSVGEGKMSVRDVRAALEARDRSKCGPVAPPDGLYLMKVDYD
ncbi:tRNA pseudouridine synthase A [Candidatus Phaeomarinobacter ectocarpi]|uniref:tRNA pseudouridine synthase A n=1 Tax=Candidatus Phaeomarinibacter ectocarpi TaxID=1458461 RepID=X5MK63_9HYPH|nr:tRNA pseudouridine(38-40) synthase TruA [Candidatus Phaeomarinobacter ectocarpi]CDO58280.1 tRNA pseudouridine synthase A [Candidatus Phaeomarinobacter ectocarpi]